MAFNKDLLSNKQSDVFVSPRNPNTTVVKEAEKVAKEAKKKAKPSLIDQLTNGSFNPGEIKEKPGYGGQSIKYADRAAVIHQMNRIFEYKWDFEPVELYNPPPLDFSKKIKNNWDIDYNMRSVAQKYIEFMK